MTYEELDKIVPEEVKLAYTTNQTHKLLEARTGLKNFDFTSIAQHLGEKIASRRAQFGVIRDGLIALKLLKG